MAVLHPMRLLAPVLVLCLLASPAHAARKPAAATAASAPVPLLWEVRGAGDSRVLLLGSFHLLQDSDYPLAEDVQQAYAQADRLVFELSPEEMTSPALAGSMLAAASRRDGSLLQKDISAADWQRLTQWSAQRAMPIERLQGLHTWFVAINLSLVEMANAGMQAELGLDRHLMQRALQDGKATAGLETGAAQIGVFTAMGQAEQQQMLAEALDEAGQGGARWRALHAAWRSGDVARIWDHAGRELQASYPALYRTINVQRNQAWLERLPQWLADGQGTTLVVVGALHLVGADGMVQQLHDSGAQVVRICTVAGCPPVEKSKRRRR